MEPRRTALAVLMLAAALTTGCPSKPYVVAYESAVSANRQKVEALKIGMTRAEVDAVMGSGELVHYKKIQLRNPWRTDVLRLDDGRVQQVLYYVTNGYAWRGGRDQDQLTPVLLENGRVVGWGWAFVARDRPRYVSGPPDPSPSRNETDSPASGSRKAE